MPSNLVPIPLEPCARYFWEGQVLDERTLHRSRWILGIRSAVGEAELIERSPRLVKVCSKEFVGRLVERALPGMKLAHLPVPPPAVSPESGVPLFFHRQGRPVLGPYREDPRGGRLCAGRTAGSGTGVVCDPGIMGRLLPSSFESTLDIAAPLGDERGENLALLFQELLTAIVRLRADRQEVTSAEKFRGQVLQAIKIADQQAKTRGYTEDDIRLGVFAVVAYLDETILNLRKPVFKDWVRKPLQEELFGTARGGREILRESAAVARPARFRRYWPTCSRSITCACCSDTWAATALAPGRTCAR